MTYFEVLVAVAYAAFADAPVDVAVVEVGMGGSWDATNVVDGQVAVVTPIDLDHEHFLGDDGRGDRHREGGHHQGRRRHRRRACRSRDGRRGARSSAASEVGAADRLRGQRLRRPRPRGRGRRAAALAARARRASTPTSSCRCTARTRRSNAAIALAAVEAFLGGGEQRLDADVVRGRARRRRPRPGGSRSCAARPTVLVDAAHNPAGARALRDGDGGLVHLRPAGRRRRACSRTRTPTEMLEILEPVLDEVVVTRTTVAAGDVARRPGRDRDRDLRRGPGDRRRRPARRARPAAGLADEGGVGGGVLATGSVITAAEVRMLLGVVEP